MLHAKIEGHGKPLLIIHGFLGMSDNWKTLATQYASQGFEVHTLDMRNHGKSFHSDQFSYAIMAQDIVAYCQQKGITKCSIIGHSMGGKIAMLLATTHPDLIEALVVADIGPKYYPPHHQLILQALNAVNFNLKPSRIQVQQTITQYIKDPATVQFLLKNLYWKEPDQLAFRFNLALFTQQPNTIGEALPEQNIFSKKTLFLRGEKSDYIKNEDFTTIYHHFPNATIQTINNAGHWLHAENPTQFLEKTIPFLIH